MGSYLSISEVMGPPPIYLFIFCGWFDWISGPTGQISQFLWLSLQTFWWSWLACTYWVGELYSFPYVFCYLLQTRKKRKQCKVDHVSNHYTLRDFMIGPFTLILSWILILMLFSNHNLSRFDILSFETWWRIWHSSSTDSNRMKKSLRHSNLLPLTLIDCLV